jgi:hypothetical protein
MSLKDKKEIILICSEVISGLLHGDDDKSFQQS